MKALLYVPIVLSLVVLGAHFLREGSEVGVAASIALIGLLVVRRRWAARVAQAALVLGAVEWLLTLYELAQWRMARGEPATRMVIILASVAIVTLVSAWLFQTKSLRRIYRFDAEERHDVE